MGIPNGVSTRPELIHAVRGDADPDPARRESAWDTFVKRYEPLIRGWCHRCGLNSTDTDEVCSRVLSKLVTALKRYDPARRFRGWLKTVVENEVRTFLRERRRHPGDQASGDSKVHERLEEVCDPSSLDEFARELDETLERDLRLAWQVAERVRKRVLPHTWQAYCRAALEKTPARDVARELGLTVAAVYMAKRNVGKMLRAEGDKLRGRP